MTSDQRGMEMMLIPMGKLPPLALDYANHLCRQVGMCMEVLLTAWCAYAEIIEGLPKGEDVAYHASEDAKKWFADNRGRYYK